MIMTLDFVAQRYGVLPSHLLTNGSSVDVMVADIAQSYQIEKQAEANAKARGENYTKPVTPPTQDEMLAMLERAKNK